MLKIERYNADNVSDPPATFASGAEIEIADQLRHRLEELYLASSAPVTPLPTPSGKDHH